jgi:hypothetical protein
MHTVYYLAHSATDRRLRWYRTRAGARIAQRQRNHNLGFAVRLERVIIGEREYERCLDSRGTVVDATWYIEEDTVEIMDLEG